MSDREPAADRVARDPAHLRTQRSNPDRLDWLALQLAGALRAAPTTEALRDAGSPRLALARLPARARPTAKAVRAAAQRIADRGVTFLGWGTEGYPRRLAPLVDAPPVLGVRGHPEVLSRDAVAIVGSRAATAYGLGVARRLAAALAEAGLVVVSGLAYGVDAAAHRGCLSAGGTTVAVQACGLDAVYPARHRALADEIAATGAVVSEFAPGQRPRRAFFPLRNRLISGLARAVVVVEARERSGSLTTARHAAEQGVEVFAVPGPIDGASHRGSNGLLREGAAPLLEPADLLDALAWPRVEVPEAAPSPPAGPADRVLRRLAHEGADTETLAAILALPLESLAATLLELELAGRIERERDGRWRLRA
ncbi:MAG: DNA-processing protein DprA [Myxococcota bacterium]